MARELEAGKSVAEVSREHQVHPTQLDQWRRALRRYGERAFAGNGRAYSDEARMAALERKIGQLTAVPPEFRTTGLCGICILKRTRKDGYRWAEKEELLRTHSRPGWLWMPAGA